MKEALLLVLISLLLGCASFNNKAVSASTGELPTSEKYLGYQPIPPEPVWKVTFYDETQQKLVENFWKSLPKDKIGELLPIQSARVTVTKNDISGKVGYLTASISGARGSYTVTMDYMKYRVENLVEGDELIGSGWIGVGLRITADVETLRSNLNLGGLMAIGLEAQQDNLNGSLRVDVIGIDSPDVTNLIPLAVEIDATSIQNALQALASIKTKLHDSNLTPHLIAIQQKKAGKIGTLKENITKGITLAQCRMRQKDVIIAAISQNGDLDKAEWDALVDRSALSDSDKTFLKNLASLKKVDDALTIDAAMNGTRISALAGALK